MKSLRDHFEENYRPVTEPCNNKQGFRIRYEYIGLWYRWNVEAAFLKKEKIIIGSACVFSCILFLAGSMQDCVVNYSRYVELFGLLSTAAYLFEFLGVVQFCLAKEKMTNMSFFDIHYKLRIAPLLHGTLLLLTAACCAAVIIQGGFFGKEMAVSASYMAAGAASLGIFARYLKLPYCAE